MPSLVLTLLPGPSRQRLETVYSYRLTYRQPEAAGAGCVMLWEVSGGRLTYQQFTLLRRETMPRN
jgi:hypothetical protein